MGAAGGGSVVGQAGWLFDFELLTELKRIKQLSDEYINGTNKITKE